LILGESKGPEKCGVPAARESLSKRGAKLSQGQHPAYRFAASQVKLILAQVLANCLEMAIGALATLRQRATNNSQFYFAG
jgi:hypothetical protein